MANSSQIQVTTNLDETQKIRGEIKNWIDCIDQAVDQSEPRSSLENASLTIEVLKEQLNIYCPVLIDLVDQVEKVSDILGHAGIVRWVLAGAVIVGFTLQRVVGMKENEAESVVLLKDLQSFIKYLYKFEMQREVADSSKLDEVKSAVAVIAKVADGCEKILKPRGRFERVLKTLRLSSSKKELQDMREFLSQEYQKLTLSKIMDIASHVGGCFTEQQPEKPTAMNDPLN